MEAWLEEQFCLLETQGSSEAFFQELSKITNALGFDFCAYGLRVPYPLSAPRTEMLNNYPTIWQHTYQEKNYLAVDPTVHHGMTSQLPIVWSDQVFSQTPELMEDARAFGLEYGWAQSSRQANGTVGMLTLARSSEMLTPAELVRYRYQLLWLTQVTHHGLASRITEEKLEMPELSLRELEMLKWTADGKTADEIATILNITARTVNFHISQAMRKLDVVNKTAATVKAALMGLI
ncbi:LuxR family transcriptional regulator [Agarivorans sp. OAG1]|uniref:LuxR family regulatory protein n=1 Tax=Agarivorans albus MKT 106 TaxID=1331007 RepID=R9PTR6_AGAAL|nr:MULTISPECIES: autoinducer binding domain-containing protein [Agarivorans]MPW29155.1 LuxR family transcriptional regulator [Agarivorans sp. B2Z047]UQN41708.1 autoinducer binding domain-containing protein [Agarivorans sp. B2Z047]BEU02314.1 LuxR family transcriptional regulator [Agarivorans sp. OAG1]GAD02886.1 luxR family regulatory protein [Agarivorans albus MKT 106]